jgi:RecA/RadA recombinase
MDINVLRTEVGGSSMADSQLFYNSSHIVATPLLLLNRFLKGGIPSSSIVEVYGAPKAGKSTLTYMIAGSFQHDHPNGIVYIIDSERSIEAQRMASFGMDNKRIIVQPVESLEDAYIKMNLFLDKVSELNEKKKKGEENTPVMMIWDTIAQTKSKAKIDNPGVQNPGGLNEEARINKKELACISGKLEKVSATLWIINQIFTHFNSYGGTSEDSGGGFGLKHGAHYKLQVKLIKQHWGDDDEDFLGSTQMSYVNLTKSKSTPAIRNIPLVINTLEGGAIDSNMSILLFFKENKLLEEPSKGWFTLPGLTKNYRLAEVIKMMEIPGVLSYFLDFFQYTIATKSSYLRTIYFEKNISDADLDKWFTDKKEKLKKILEKVAEKEEEKDK